MKHLFRFLAVLPLILHGQEKVDTAMMSLIRDEGLNRSHGMEMLLWLTDVYGPRLAGSPEYDKAAEWAKEKLEGMGLANAHLEPWGPFGKAWRLKKYSAMIIGRQNQPLVSYPKAWSPGLGSREVVADAIYFNPETDSAIQAYKGKLKGKFVLTGLQPVIHPSFEPNATRVTDSSLLVLANAGMPDTTRRRRPRPSKEYLWLNYNKWQLFIKENAAAVLTSAPSPLNGEGGVWVMGAYVPNHPDTPYVSPNRFRSYQSRAPKIPPQIEVSNEHFNRLLRLLEKEEKVKIAMTLDVEWTSQKDEMSSNVIAELPGSDLKDEVVMIGGHLDSWHGGTGATDNATGVVACMEAMRILKAVNARPRRTIRIALWGGEEQGELGSDAYVAEHFGSKDSLKPEGEKFSAYFNHDNGTGKIRGVFMQGNEAVRPIFRAWLAPFEEMGAATLTLSNTGSTDHMAFDNIGLPGFQFIQDDIEYSSRTWHTTNDVYDRVIEEDVKQAAVIMAAFAYNAAMRDEKLPRKVPSAPSGGAGYDEEWDCGHVHE